MIFTPIEPMKPMEFSESGKVQIRKQEVKHSSFQNILDSAVYALNDTYTASRDDAYQLAFGNVDDMSGIMINTLKAESMIQTTVQITSRVISAYKEIMNIQV
jgi:flagellar hook-basal body complex protein FliE